MDNLTDTTKLIDELTSKLLDLDKKVSVYRLGMATEFTKYSEELLKNVPDDVAYRVSRAIEESLPNFPSLYPPGSQPSSRSHTPTILEEIAWHGNKSPPPILPHTSGQPKEPQNHNSSKPSQTIQRERDQEFSGLFVPSYLPLLDSVDRPPHLPTASLDASGSAELEATSTPELTQSSDGRRARQRPVPLRRSTTDTSVDSVASDTSSAKTRKSALRRSSASSKADSPRESRRVRFDFAGKEVLPSSSPQTSTDTLTDADTTRSQEKSAEVENSYAASEGDIEGEQDEHTEKPKKVSSSQALRALSKAPLDEGTVWTVVNPGTGSEESSETHKIRYTPESNSPRSSSLVSNTTENMAPTNTQADDTIRPAFAELMKEAEVEKRAAAMEESEEEQYESDDEPALFMISKRGFKKKSKGIPLQDDNGSESYATKLAPSPVRTTQSAAATSSPTASACATIAPQVLTDAEKPARSVGKTTGVVEDGAVIKAQAGHKDVHSATPVTKDDDDDDELFAFDGDEKNGNKVKKYLPESHDEEHNEEVVSRSAKNHEAYDDLPSSPPISVPARAAPSPEHQVPKKVPPHPESTRQPSTSIGSLGNRSLTPGPVKDQQLLEKVSKLDVEVPFFVGSVNGRSGPDASNVKSYQASLMSPTQASGSFASGSFAERLMWEKSQGILYDSDAEDNKKNDRQTRR